jgi:uncharacterized membrane protein YkoI
MKKLFPLLIIIFFASCSSTKKSQTGSSATSAVTSSDVPATSPKSSAQKDGSNYEKAIVIKAKNEAKGVAEEYKWLREQYPGYKLIEQSLSSEGKKHYDILKIQTKDGEEKSIYFDITNFFGKW